MLTEFSGLSKILCVRLDAMGDVLMTEPAIRALKERNPSARLTLLTSQAGAEAARLIPEIDETMIYAAPWMKAGAIERLVGVNPDSSEFDLQFIAQLKAAKFDAAVIFTVYSQSPLPAAYLCYLAGISKRLAHCRENPYGLLTHWIPEMEPEKTIRHEVRRQLELVASVGCFASQEKIRIRIESRAERRVESLLDKMGFVPGEPFIVVHPGASAVSRRYPADNFAKVVRALCSKTGWRVLLTGSEAEADLIDEVRAKADTFADGLAGSLTLAEFGALLSRATLLVANNTGAVHLGAAVGVPIVDLYALTNPQHTPWNVPNRVLSHKVDCAYCYKSVCPHGHGDCLRLIEPETVVTATMDLMSELGLMGSDLGGLLEKSTEEVVT